MATTCSCVTAAAARASRMKRLRAVPLAASCGRQHLDGDDAVQLLVERLEHDADAALADHLLNLVMSQPAELPRLRRRREEVQPSPSIRSDASCIVSAVVLDPASGVAAPSVLRRSLIRLPRDVEQRVAARRQRLQRLLTGGAAVEVGRQFVLLRCGSEPSRWAFQRSGAGQGRGFMVLLVLQLLDLLANAVEHPLFAV